MKALSLLIALHLCLSSGQQWVTAIRPPYPVATNNGNRYVDATAKRTDDVVNLFSQPVDKSYAGNELLRNNGVQNNLSFNSRRAFGDDVDVKQGVKKVNNYIYFLNETNDNPQSGRTFTSAASTNLPFQANLNGASGRYWVNENNQNYKKSYLIPPRPSWDQQYLPFPPKPSPDNWYPDNNDNNGWYTPDPNEIQCYDLVEIIRDLRRLLQKSTISEEKVSLKRLFRVIKEFILNNNLQYASFSSVVREIENILLNTNNHNNLREDEIVQILQEFKNRELYYFLLEIRSHRETSLEVAVSKLALLLYRLKKVLIQRRYSEETIRVVINRAVQWSVPLVGYYFERECKIKTQQYIVRNLEVALNVKLESVKHVENLDELQTESNVGILDNFVGFDGLNQIGDSNNVGNLGGLENLLNPIGPGNQVNIVELGGVGSLGGPGNLEGLGNQGVPGGLGNLENPGGKGNRGHPGGLGG